MVSDLSRYFTLPGAGEEDDARHALHRLSIQDPAVCANMARYAVAAGLLVTGVRGRHRTDEEAHFVSGFILSPAGGRTMVAAVNRLGGSHVFLAFDVDDALAGPRAMGVIRVEDDAVVTYPLCGLWAPKGDGRAVIVPTGRGAPHCHFVARRHRPLARVEGLPLGDLEAGLRRGRQRLERLARSPALDGAHAGAHLSFVQKIAGGFAVQTERLAA